MGSQAMKPICLQPVSTCPPQGHQEDHAIGRVSGFMSARSRYDSTNTHARTIVATFDASVSNPQAMRQAPIKLLPRYPAGSVMAGIPPDILVAPPSSAKQARSVNSGISSGKVK